MKCSRAGYTLIEMLIASILIAALMSAVWGMMSMYNSYLVLGQRQTRQQQLSRSLLQLLEDDLQMVALPDAAPLPVPDSDGFGLALTIPEFSTVPNPGPGSNSLFSGEAGGLPGGLEDLLQPVSIPGQILLSGDRTSLRLESRRSNVGPQLESGEAILQDPEPADRESPRVDEFVTIVYQFQSPETGGTPSRSLPAGLYRIETATLPLRVMMDQRTASEQNQIAVDQLPVDRELLESVLLLQATDRRSQSAVNAEDAALQTLLKLDRVPEVVACRFSYFDGRFWLPDWDSGERGELPRAIRVQLRLTSQEMALQLMALTSTSASDTSRDNDLISQELSLDPAPVEMAAESGSELGGEAGDPLQALRSVLIERIVLLQPAVPVVGGVP